MNAETVARWQFGITTVYHYFFVPMTIALSALVAVLQTMWVRTGKEKYLRLTKFYGKLFLINFVLGVVTGIVQEFQFGMNWSEYSRFVGDIFGAPLAFEALLAFFMESTFVGLWVFGWDRLPKRLHLATIWLVAAGTMISAIFILAANSFMQNPVGGTYNPVTQRAEMTDFGAVLTNPVFLATFPHTLAGAYMVAGAFVAAVAGWHLSKLSKQGDEASAEDVTAYRFAAKFGAWVLIVAGLATIVTGDIQGKVMTDVQPMKMAAAEALYSTEGGGSENASFSIFTVGTLDGSQEVFSIKVPYVLSFLATGDIHGKVQGVNDLVAQYRESGYMHADNPNSLEAKYAEALIASGYDFAHYRGTVNYVPDIAVTYWAFRLMIGLGLLAMAIGAWLLWVLRKENLPKHGKVWTGLMIALPLLPLFANSFGWLFTELGRQPWLVNGVLTTAAGVSPGVSQAEVWITMILFTLVYGGLAVVEVGLMLKYLKMGLPVVEEPKVLTDEDQPLTFAY
jgi:cytochrome d ubiquinol oxidase subunit I